MNRPIVMTRAESAAFGDGYEEATQKYKAQITQLNAELRAVASELLKAQQERDGANALVNQVELEAANLKAVLLPYIQSDVECGS